MQLTGLAQDALQVVSGVGGVGGVVAVIMFVAYRGREKEFFKDRDRRDKELEEERRRSGEERSRREDALADLTRGVRDALLKNAEATTELKDLMRAHTVCPYEQLIEREMELQGRAVERFRKQREN